MKNDQEWTCPVCGKPNPSDTDLCQRCGRNRNTHRPLVEPPELRSGSSVWNAALPLWTHPGVWMLLAFSYCTPGAFLTYGFVDQAWWYLPVAPMVVFAGTAIVGFARGRRAAGVSFLLMVCAVAAGFIANLELIYSGNWSWFLGLSPVVVVIGVGMVWSAKGWKAGVGALVLTVVAGVAGLYATCALTGVNWGLVVVC